MQLGGELLRDRAIFKRLAETPEARKALVLLFDAILTRGTRWRRTTRRFREPQPLVLARFARDARNAKLNGRVPARSATSARPGR